MWNDLRHSARLLRRAPAFTAAAVFTLALGIGLNAAVMSLVEAVLLRPLPYRDSERVVFVWTQRGDAAAPSTYDYSDGPQTPDDFLKWRAHNWTLEDMAAVQLWKHDTGSRFDLVEADRTERLRGAFATPNFFTMLGVQAEIGRTFSDADLQRTDVAVISNGLWRRLYAEDPQVVGKTIRVLAGRARREVRSLTIIGVLGPEFRFTYPEETEVWTPLPWDAVAKAPRVAVMYQVIGRLRAGASPQAAAADLTRLTKPVIAGDGRTLRYMVRAATAREKLARDARPLLLTLSAVAALVLAIACVNVANLLLARAVARSREIATRVALGATRLRVLRQLLLESSVLTALGAAAGLALAALALPAFRAVIPLALPRAADARIDTLVLAATLAAALVAVLLGSLASFMFGTSARPLERMRQGGVGGTRATLWRNSVTAAQVAIVFVLIAGAGLLLKSFWRVTHVDLGYDGHQVLTMEMRLLNARYSDDARQQAFQREVLDAVKALPGVQEAAVTSAVPLRGTDWLRRLHIETRDPGAPALVFAHEREVTPEYFTVMRVSLLQGRLFTAADDDSALLRAARSSPTRSPG
jgi:putative ABC transport system permease protein